MLKESFATSSKLALILINLFFSLGMISSNTAAPVNFSGMHIYAAHSCPGSVICAEGCRRATGMALLMPLLITTVEGAAAYET
jgi:hypothetical protein